MALIPDLPVGENEKVVGPLFLSVAYGFILLNGANYISYGSELLLEVISPGIIGGLLLPILGALPDAVIILMSGLGGDAQEQVAIGIGTLAGSTIMLLTVAWAGSIIVGRCDLLEREDGSLVAQDRTLGKHNDAWDLQRTGITTDEATRTNSWSMLLTNLLYLIVVIPALAHDHNIPSWIAMGACLFCLAAYCAYQVMSPGLQKKRLQRAKSKVMKAHAVRNAARLSAQAGLSFFERDGSISWDAVDAIFDKFDTDHSDSLEMHEVKGLISGLILTTVSSKAPKVAEDEWMREIDKDGNGTCSREEFKAAMEAWLSCHPSKPHTRLTAMSDSDEEPPDWNPHSAAADLENASLAHLLLEDEEEEEEEEGEGTAMTPGQIYTRAIGWLVWGSVIIFVFSDPLVATLGNLATATSIPKFVVGFVVTPFASNSSELVSSLMFAAKRRRKNISLTFSQVYGAVTMNNTMCFGVFMALFAVDKLKWTQDFTIEIAVNMVAILLVGLLATRGRTFPTWLAPPVLLIYPLSLAAICLLQSALK